MKQKIKSLKIKNDLKSQLVTLQKENQRLKAALLTDDLTGLGNYRSLRVELEKIFSEITKKIQGTTQVALLFIDVDSFKSVNQTHGHWAASKLLGMIGRRISRAIRETDHAFRYGGDEFVVLVMGPKKNIYEMASRIQKAIASKPFEVSGFQGAVKVPLSVSLGVRILTPTDSLVQVVEEADRALFEAKKRQKQHTSLAA
jgi:diguanylate cyclase (GGDEF)-like protein